MFLKILLISREDTCVEVSFNGAYRIAYRSGLQHRCFPVEFGKFLRTPTFKKICERLLLKRVQISSELHFLITYISRSNWYICFSFCIIIYSFVCQFSLTTIGTAAISSSRRWCSAKTVFLQISQNSHENTCAKDSLLMKLRIYRVLLYKTRDSGTDVSLWIMRNFS